LSEQVTVRPINFLRPARFTHDGRIVFSARTATTWELFERNPASRSLQRLGVRGAQLAAISPTNEFAVFQPFLPEVWLSATLSRVAGGGGTPRVVAERVRSADWGPSGDLAIIRSLPSGSTLEYPTGKILFQTKEPAWLEDVRVSPQANLLAFIHHPASSFSGELVILDLAGVRRGTSKRWHRIKGVAWAPGNEAWFTAGDDGWPRTIRALRVEGPEHEVYRALSEIVLHDVSQDGRVLVGEGFHERDIAFVGGRTPGTQSLAWNEVDFGPTLSADGGVVLFSSRDLSGQPSALLRETSGSPPQDLGEGFGCDLTPDGRTALLCAPEGGLLSLVTTGAESGKSVRIPELTLKGVQLAGGTSRAIAIAQTSDDAEWRLYSIDLGTGVTSLVSPRAVEPEGAFAVSPDGKMVAVLTRVEAQKYPTIFPLSGGEPLVVRSLGADVAPAGWVSNDQVWLTRVESPEPSEFELIRFDVRRRAPLEVRRISSGLGLANESVRVTPDGKNVVFVQQRIAGHLYVLRGLVGAR
jgi:hypothetical protein